MTTPAVKHTPVPPTVATGGEPLIFIEVALMKNVAQTIQVSPSPSQDELNLVIYMLIDTPVDVRKFCGMIPQYLNVRQLVHYFTPYHQLSLA
ncbi:hypothetical protein RHGRI_004369 [Rhododendron griersonianum]|uniref:Uncharacterized protein n=1 Tax=Rhododendron griersonianum TaxID=479676 RepID=A0AAV6LA54_9ERIC|nr:hypothetical protein RHGRI_004369 [Rhododendron griersonianum]